MRANITSPNQGLSPIPAAVAEGHRFLVGRHWLLVIVGEHGSEGFNGFDGVRAALGDRWEMWWRWNSMAAVILVGSAAVPGNRWSR